MSSIDNYPIETVNSILVAVEKEIDKRIIMGGRVHNEDLIHFLMADYQFDEKIAKEYVDLYTSYFTEDVQNTFINDEDDDPT